MARVAAAGQTVDNLGLMHHEPADDRLPLEHKAGIYAYNDVQRVYVFLPANPDAVVAVWSEPTDDDPC